MTLCQQHCGQFLPIGQDKLTLREKAVYPTKFGHSMTEDTENLVLEILKKIQSDVAFVRQDVNDLKIRTASVENHLAAFHLDLVQISARVDTLGRRMERVETRLGLIEA